jgi:hypothetical protein
MDYVQCVSQVFGEAHVSFYASLTNAFNAIKRLDTAVFVHRDDGDYFVRACVEMNAHAAA